MKVDYIKRKYKFIDICKEKNIKQCTQQDIVRTIITVIISINKINISSHTVPDILISETITINILFYLPRNKIFVFFNSYIKIKILTLSSKMQNEVPQL